MRFASPSTIAVLPTPGSPIRTGLFLRRRERTCATRRISTSRPITGSSLPLPASSVRFARVLLQRLEGRLGVLAGHLAPAADLGDRRLELIRVESARGEQALRGRSALARDRDEQMLGREVLVLELRGERLRLGQNRLEVARGAELAARGPRQFVEFGLEFGGSAADEAPRRSSTAAETPSGWVSSAAARCSGVSSGCRDRPRRSGQRRGPRRSSGWCGVVAWRVERVLRNRFAPEGASRVPAWKAPWRLPGPTGAAKMAPWRQIGGCAARRPHPGLPKWPRRRAARDRVVPVGAPGTGHRRGTGIRTFPPGRGRPPPRTLPEEAPCPDTENTLDCRELQCPMPIVRLSMAVRKLDAGAELWGRGDRSRLRARRPGLGGDDRERAARVRVGLGSPSAHPGGLTWRPPFFAVPVRVLPHPAR